ncbi:eight-cysteine-cluster domain-containing protein [Candidatus Woesearchaeota archaeon]|nr:eight-cysteine-cluster domain-containing protein [Candidatus Woesearchaeota archaeon]
MMSSGFLRIVSIIAMMLCIVFLTACSDDASSIPVPSQHDIAGMFSCVSDDDCVCGGIDAGTGRCFLGNKVYYDNFVDKKKECPDFCSGIGGNLMARCVDTKCMQVLECLNSNECSRGEQCIRNRCTIPGKSSCSKDSDCSRQGCSGQVCASRNDDPVMTTCEYLPEYDCLGMIDCGCVDNGCDWKTTDEYDDCVSIAKGE